MAPGPFLQLNNGYRIPQLGFGTLDIANEKVTDVVKEAFDTGYRHIDCAMIYGNEKEVGRGIAESMKKHGLKREDIFVTSKLWCDKHDPKDVRKACEESIEKLGLDYLDLYLIHWPIAFHKKEGPEPECLVFEDRRFEDTWVEMEKLIPAGLVRSVGVSNFNKSQIERIIKCGKTVPAVNQIEVNLHCPNTKLIEYCQSKNIVVEGFAPFGSPSWMKGLAEPILELRAVLEIAKFRNVTPAQVLIRHALQRNIVIIAKSATADRIRANYDVLGFELTEEEMDQLNKAGLNKRIFAWPHFANQPDYPFHDEY